VKAGVSVSPKGAKKAVKGTSDDDAAAVKAPAAAPSVSQPGKATSLKLSEAPGGVGGKRAAVSEEGAMEGEGERQQKRRNKAAEGGAAPKPSSCQEKPRSATLATAGEAVAVPASVGLKGKTAAATDAAVAAVNDRAGGVKAPTTTTTTAAVTSPRAKKPRAVLTPEQEEDYMTVC
jgi:hypothetical protein